MRVEAADAGWLFTAQVATVAFHADQFSSARYAEPGSGPFMSFKLGHSLAPSEVGRIWRPAER